MLKFINAAEEEFEIPKKYCETWLPVRNFREDLGDDYNEDLVHNLQNVSKSNIEHMMKWYEHFDQNPVNYSAMVYENGEIVKKENVNPFDDLVFDRDNDPDLDLVEDINQLSRWRLKEYAENFKDDFTKNWVGDLFSSKSRFYSFIGDFCYIGCQVPLAICAQAMSDKIDEIVNLGHGDEIVKGIIEYGEYLEDIQVQNYKQETDKNEQTHCCSCNKEADTVTTCCNKFLHDECLQTWKQTHTKDHCPGCNNKYILTWFDNLPPVAEKIAEVESSDSSSDSEEEDAEMEDNEDNEENNE